MVIVTRSFPVSPVSQPGSDDFTFRKIHAPTTSVIRQLKKNLTILHGLGISISEGDVEPGPNPGDPSIRFAAPGNIGDAERTQLDVSLLQPLDFILPGAQISLTGSLVETEVTDPITGQPREISGTSEKSFNFEFRHDIASIPTAWGFTWEKGRENPSFLAHDRRDPPFVWRASPAPVY